MRIFAAILLTMLIPACHAQTDKGQTTLPVRIDSALQARYKRVNYDTAYISRPIGRLTLKTRVNVFGNSIHSRVKAEGMTMTAHLHTETRSTISLNANYRGISAGLSFNPASFKGKSKDYEFNLNLYNNRYSIDACYQTSKTLSGDINYDGGVYRLDKGLVKTEMLLITGYYVFNHRRFSYPAAFTQSFVQRRSAGSWLAGFSYQGGKMKTAVEDSEEMPSARLFVGHFAVGGGYAYNFVLGRKWLLHLSAMPTLVVLNLNNVTVEGERKKMPTRFPEMILNNRFAAVYNITPRCFLALTAVNNSSVFVSKTRRTNQTKWQTRFSVGVRL